MTGKSKPCLPTNNIQNFNINGTKIRIRPFRDTDLDALHVLFMNANTTARKLPYRACNFLVLNEKKLVLLA